MTIRLSFNGDKIMSLKNKTLKNIFINKLDIMKLPLRICIFVEECLISKAF
jgi:hypothetical protein